MDKIYYQDQIGWSKDDFYFLNRYLNKMILYNERYAQEISELDINKLSEITKVLLCVIVKFQKKEWLVAGTELESILDSNPLKDELYLVENPIDCHAIYREYNVRL